MAKRDRRSAAQILLGIHLRELGFQRIEYEYEFYPERRWAADIYLPDHGLLIECDGIHQGGHKRHDALADDYLKQNTAQMLGFRILRFSNEQVESGEAKAWLAPWVKPEYIKLER